MTEKSHLERIEEKIDGLSNSVNEWTRQMEGRVTKVETKVENIELTYPTRMENIYLKIKSHVEGHWKWIATTAGVIGIWEFFSRRYK